MSLAETAASAPYRNLIVGANPSLVKKLPLDAFAGYKILSAGVDVREPLAVKEWLNQFGDYLETNPKDVDFRFMMNSDNPYGFWANRPYEFSRSDIVEQEWPHHETVGNHTHSVVQKLDTETPLNGINYLNASRRGMIKALRAAAFFHDIAKVRNVGDAKHPQHSAELSEAYFEALKFTSAQAWLCHFLIRFHDVIGKAVNQKERDVEVDLVAAICNGSPAILQCLRAITIADITSIPELSYAAGYNIIPKIKMAVHLAYQKIQILNANKVNKKIILPVNPSSNRDPQILRV